MRQCRQIVRAAARCTLELLETRRLLSGEGLELDFGDAPDSYRTTLAVNGARDVATPNLHLGSFVDTEPDGQPDVNALRDDLNGVPDDEDGIIFLTSVFPGANVSVQITNGAAQGFLNAWLDFNLNGAFDATEQIFTNLVLPAASVTVHNFVVPAGATIGDSYARFRLNPIAGIGPAGFGDLGEVEDYAVKIEEGDKLDFGDAPDSAAGPFFYPTIFAGASGDPARHVFAPNGPRLGPMWDPEPDGQPNLTATGDDLAALDDEDGITVGGVPLEMVPLAAGAVLPLDVTNTGAAGLLNAWFDWNLNGSWEAAEQVAVDMPIPAGVTPLPVLVPAGIPVGSFIYSRFRLSTTAGLSPKGLASDGEVEDYRNLVEESHAQLDFGDAPDAIGTPFMYPTMLGGLSGDPARHQIMPGAPMLGPNIDAEPDGQQTLLANGDDTGGIDDEDGVRIGGMPMETVPLVAGSVMQIQVTNGGAAAGRLNAWFDWNENGNWEPATEQVAFDVPIGPGVTINLPVAVPGFLTANSQIFSRFRISTTPGLTPRGFAPDGEVEDYRNRVLPDTVPPSVIAGTLEFETRQAITLSFSEPLNPLTVSATDLSALNLDDGTTPVATSVILSAGNTVATWVFNTPGTFINDGDYQFTLPAGAVSDVAGLGLAPNFVLSGPGSFFFGGDANRDRTVNLLDFNIMAANFGMANKTFSQGNFDYDALGLVSLLDFNILAARFGMSVAPDLGGGGSMFGDDPIGEASLRDIVEEVLTM